MLDIVFNIVGGIIVAGLTFLFGFFKRKFKDRALRNTLGSKCLGHKLVYNQLTLRLPKVIRDNVPSYIKFWRPLHLNKAIQKALDYPYTNTRAKNSGIYAEHITSECELRAISYLTTLVGKGNIQPDSVRSTEGSFIALGGGNFKTIVILESDANIFMQDIDALKGYACTDKVDHGYILRLRSTLFPEHSFIVCAGLGEYGTSGAAWFLANKWRELNMYGKSFRNLWGLFKQSDFLAIVKVENGVDDSTQLVSFQNKGEAKMFLSEPIRWQPVKP